MHTATNRDTGQHGYVMVVVVIILTSLSVFGILLWDQVATFIYTQKRADLQEKVLALAEGGLDKAIWELNADDLYTGESNTLLGEGEFTTVVTTLSDTSRSITTTGYIPNATKPIAERSVTIKALRSGSVVNFNYGMQAGEGGISLGNNNDIDGSVYSNGNITASNNSTITGDVWVAGSAGPTSELVFDDNVTPGQELPPALEFDDNNPTGKIEGVIINNTVVNLSQPYTMEAWIYPRDYSLKGIGGAIVGKGTLFRFATEDMPGLPASIHLAEEMGAGLGRRKILLGKM